MNSTILVDWALLRTHQDTQNFIAQREGQANMVLLVSQPKTDDFDHDPENHPGVPDIQWDAVIRNTGGLPDVVFKATALTVLQDSSNLEPVVGLDPAYEVNNMYREGGVLVTALDLPNVYPAEVPNTPTE